MTVNNLKQVLENALASLDGFDDDAELNFGSDTYNLVKNDARNLLCVVGREGGYLDLNNIEVKGSDSDDE